LEIISLLSYFLEEKYHSGFLDPVARQLILIMEPKKNMWLVTNAGLEPA
jgi:hypothetical protein